MYSQVNSAFNEKRKMIRKSLQHICTSVEIEEALENIGLLSTVSYQCVLLLLIFCFSRISLTHVLLIFTVKA